MHKGIDNILKVCCSFVSSKVGYVLKFAQGDLSIITSISTRRFPQNLLKELKSDLISENRVRNQSFERIVNHFKNQSILFEEIYNDSVSKYFLIIVGKEDNIISAKQNKNFIHLKEVLFHLIRIKNTGGLFPEDFQRVLCNNHLVIFSINLEDSTLNSFQGNVFEIFDLSFSHILERPIGMLRRISFKDYPEIREFKKKIFEGFPNNVEFRYLGKNKLKKFIRLSAFPIMSGNKIVRVSGIISDITIQKKSLIQLEESVSIIKQLVDTASDLIFSLDEDGNFITVNKNGAAALNYFQHEMIGKHFLEFINENDKSKVAVAFEEILKADGMISFEVNFENKNGRNVIFEIIAHSKKGDGKIAGIQAIGRDITSRLKDENRMKNLNAKLAEANRIISIERDRAKKQLTVLEEIGYLKNQFISSISHELRTPLSSIVGFAETISSDPNMAREKIYEFNQIIFTESKRLAQLINDILDFSKLESDTQVLERNHFNLIALLNDIVMGFIKQAEDKDIILSKEIPDSVIILFGDKERIRKCISHLISNSIKFTNANGRIKIIVRDFLKEVEISIIDTGVGIAEDDLPKLFEKFTKVGKKSSYIQGAGIGLAYVKQIIQLHNGIIRIKSGVGEGTTVIVKLPKYEQQS